MTGAELEALLLAGDAAACIAALAAIPEAERRALHPIAAAAAKRFAGGEFVPEEPTSRWVRHYTVEQERCAVLATCGTCTAGELGKIARKALFDEVVPLWAALRPSFLPRAAEVVVVASPHNFAVARALVRQGLSDRPEAPEYVVGFLAWWARQWHARRLEDAFDEDPGLLDDEVWRLFEVEGGGEFSLAASDKYTRAELSWSAALLRLAAAGRLSRDRLLDASLSALERDFAQFRAGWFSRFHEALAPTIEERAARLPVYLRLLGSPIGPTVALALDAVAAIDALVPIPAEDLLAHVETVLRSRAQGHARAGLKLLRAAASRARCAPRAGALAAVALSHETAAVQKEALALLEALDVATDPEVRAAVAAAAPLVAASLRTRLAPWLDAAPAPEAAPEGDGLLAERVPRCDPSRAVTPLADLDAAIDALARLLEDASDPDLVEQALSAVARLRRDDRAADRLGPVLARAQALLQRGIAGDHPVRNAIARLVVAWGSGQLPAAPPHLLAGSLYDVLDARIGAIATGAASTLCAPTHRGGWIAPAALVERVRRLGAAPFDPLDAVIALLRLAPDDRPAALAGARDLTGELADALRHALGGDVAIGPTAALWIAAARARAPDGDDPAVEARHPGLGPNAGQAARYAWRARGGDLVLEVAPRRPRTPPVAHVAVWFVDQAKHWGVAGWEKALVRWSATLWPAGTEALCADGLPTLWDNVDWSGAEWHNVAYLEPLREGPIGPMARLLLGVELGAKEPGESALAVDVAIAAIADGRLDGGSLGDVLASLRPTGHFKLARWAKALGLVAAASPGHASHVATAIQRALRGDPADAPRDEGALVALLVELLAERGATVDDREAWAYLSASRHRAKVRVVAPTG